MQCLLQMTGPVGSILIYADQYGSIQIYKNQISGIDLKYGSIKIFADQFWSIKIYADLCRSMWDQPRPTFIPKDLYWSVIWINTGNLMWPTDSVTEYPGLYRVIWELLKNMTIRFPLNSSQAFIYKAFVAYCCESFTILYVHKCISPIWHT